MLDEIYNFVRLLLAILYVTSNPGYALLKDKLIGRSVLFGRESTGFGGSMTHCIGITIMKEMRGRQI